MTLTGRVVAVTGGARGIGAAIAETAARQGASVVIGDIDHPAPQPGCLALPLDVTDPASWRTFVDGVEDRLSRVDVLVNNAGIMPIGPFVDETDEATRRQLDINVLGVLLGCRAVLPGMLERRRGHLVNIASMAGSLGVAGTVTYCATKFAVVGATEALADELRDTPVSVSAILPGVVNTELSLGLPSSRLVPHVEPSDVADAVLATIAKPRDEVWVPASGRASFRMARLLSPRARYRLLSKLGLGDAMLTADRSARAAYEARVAAHGSKAT